MAHRGGGNKQPKILLSRLKRCARKGSPTWKPMRMSQSDGVAVIYFHDPMLDRITDGSGLISVTPGVKFPRCVTKLVTGS